MTNPFTKNRKQALAVAAVLALGLLAAALILRTDDKHPSQQSHAEEEEHGHDEAAAEPGHARITDAQLLHNGIALAAAGPARIGGQLELLGEVKLNQDRRVFVTPRLNGLVESVHANAGDAVQRGQLLAVISSQALGDQRGGAGGNQTPGPGPHEP